MNAGEALDYQRRARPLLGTLVEIGVGSNAPAQGIDAAFDAIESAQRALSRFDPHSDIARFNAAAVGARLAVRPLTCDVLRAACELASASDGMFDISTGTGADGWSLEGEALIKHGASTCLDLGGIGKGHAVDLAIDALIANGCASG